jgi:Xaa-Pro aminopeptidase
VLAPVLLAMTVLAALVAAPPDPPADDRAELKADLVARRARLMAALDPSTIFVAWSAPPRLYSRDVDYEYRQDSNLLYLTGVTQEDTILVLMPGNATTKDILFVRPPDPRREHWVGHSLTKEEAAEATGVATVHDTSQFEPFITAMFNQQAYGERRAERSVEFDRFFAAVAAGTAKMALVFGPRPAPSAPLTPPYDFASRARDRFVGLSFVDATPLVENLRQVKTPYEQRILRRSVEISSEAHMAGMRAAAPGKFEHQVEAAIERVYLDRGAMSPGYPSIVGSGPNATVLHYSASSRRMEAGDLLLVDAAANYRHLSGDITRTYPVSGTFSPAQRELYRVVLEAQDAGIAAAKAGNRAADVETAVADAIAAGLLRLGLVTDVSGDQFRTWYTHGICHWIGMDVHDAGDDERPFEPGMAFVIEPGVYIREAALDALADTPENRAFKEKVKPAVDKYKGLGIRIEDSFLLTASGLERLSAKVPRTIEEIEAFMRR